MTECPNCEKAFRGFRCECGYEPTPIPVPRMLRGQIYQLDSPEEIQHRRERLEEIKRQFQIRRKA